MTTPTAPSPSERAVRHLLEDAALFNLLGRAFAYPTDAQWAAVGEAAARVAAARTRRRTPAVTRAIGEARRAWHATAPAALQAEYVRLFLGGALCPLHETAYGDGRRIAGRPVELADVQGFYRAFGFAQSDRNPDLPDHLCCELEFHSLLLVKEAYAATEGWREPRRVARRAAAAFVEYHLGRWVGALARALGEHEAAAPYRAFAALLMAAVDVECRRLRIRPQPAAGRLPADFMQDDQFTCPMAGGPVERDLRARS